MPRQEAEKKGPDEPVDHCLGRSWGGLGTKVQLLCGANIYPLSFTLSFGQQADSRTFILLLDQHRDGKYLER